MGKRVFIFDPLYARVREDFLKVLHREAISEKLGAMTKNKGIRKKLDGSFNACHHEHAYA